MSFFEGTEVRQIPDYQRPYSWTNKNILDLLHDVAKIANGERDSWFLGPLFTTKVTPSAEISDLLDGQQRITTIQILLREASILPDRIDGLDLYDIDNVLSDEILELQENCRKCLKRTVRGEFRTKFITESSIKNLFFNYIKDFNNIRDNNDYRAKLENLNSTSEHEIRQGSKTAKTFKNARKTIEDYLTSNFILDDIVEGMRKFQKYINSLLFECWIIEIPLLQANDSIQIFESLNNRGKSLTLTDKLRYKSLIFCSDSEFKIELKSQWKNIYMGLDNCTENGFFKSDEDFFKIFFNVKAAKSITREEDMMAIFEREYLTDVENIDNSIKKFIDECLNILHFYEYVVFKNLDIQNEFIESFRSQNEKLKVRALIQLTEKTSFSDNSRFLLFAIIMKHYSSDNISDSNYSLVQDLWVFVRIIFVIECLLSKKSNAIRTEILSIISRNNDSWNLLKYFNDKIDTDFSISKNLLNDLLQPNGSGEGKFIISLYCYLNNYESLISHVGTQVQEAHLEHLFPIKWQQNWSDKKFTKNDINDFLDNHIQEDFSALKKDENGNLMVIQEIKNKERLELYESQNAKQTDTLIQFIGNKWIVHASTNISGSNLSFREKKEKYGQRLYVKIPSNDNNEIGLDLYDDFDFRDVITRSLRIANGILSKFYQNWDEVS